MNDIKCSALDNIEQGEKYYEELYPNVWLMDNHKWAFYAWEVYRFRHAGKIPSILVHIDMHWDGVNDFQNSETVAKLINASDEQSLMDLMVRKSSIRYDSFIAPAIIRGFVREVHFYCVQDEADIGLDADLLHRYDARQFIHKNIDSLIQQVDGRPILFDFDLDIFNKSEQWSEGDIWPEGDIVSFLDKCAELVLNSSLCTIAMSFNYSGTANDTRYLARLVVPKIIQNIQDKG